MGLTGTLAHRLGGRAFPRRATTLEPSSADIRSARARGPRDVVEEEALVESHRLMSLKKMAKTKYADELAECMRAAVPEEILRERQMLLGASQWFGIVHSCPCVHVRLDVEQAVMQEQFTQGSVSCMAEEWKSRHAVIDPTSLGQLPVVKPKPGQRCRDHNYCFCSAEGKRRWLFYSRFKKAMQQRFAKEAAKQLQDGHIFIVFRGLEVVESGEMILRSYSVVNVVSHLIRPWCVTFLNMTAAEGQSKSEELLRNARPDETEESLSVLLETTEVNQGLELMQPSQLFEKFDLAYMWDMCCMTASESHAPFPTRPGVVKAYFRQEAPSQLWHGAAEAPLRDELGPVAVAADGADDDERAQESEGEEPSFLDAMLMTISQEPVESSSSSSDGTSEDSSSSSVLAGCESTSSEMTGSESTSSEGNNSNGDDHNEARGIPDAELDAHQPAVLAAPAARDRREETFVWGTHRFLFTHRPPSTYQVTCRYHATRERTKCTKSCSWQVGDGLLRGCRLLSESSF